MNLKKALGVGRPCDITGAVKYCAWVTNMVEKCICHLIKRRGSQFYYQEITHLIVSYCSLGGRAVITREGGACNRFNGESLFIIMNQNLSMDVHAIGNKAGWAGR